MNISKNIPIAVRRAYMSFIIEINKEVFSFDEVVKYIERWRGKKMCIEYDDDMSAGLSGYCAALRDCDLICTWTNLDVILNRRVRLHELSHFMLNHIEKYPHGKNTPSYKVFMRRRKLHQDTTQLSRFYPAIYEGPHEYNAEVLAAILDEAICKYEVTTPDFIHIIHG